MTVPAHPALTPPHPAASARVLHVGEAALTARQLVDEARREGLRWDDLPLATTRRDWTTPLARAQWAALGAAWLARLTVSAARHDIVHIHSASTYQHSQYATRRFVLHAHGTDVRTAQYEEAFGPVVRAALTDAEAVLYSTPDLAEHVLPQRPDATYLPVPITTRRLPPWRPDPERPRIAFASRWEDVKGLQTQLEVAAGLVAAVGDRAEVVGLDWGPAAPAAAALGVRLVPKLPHAGYLEWLAGSTAVVGQSAGILSASELEALGSGAPLLQPVPLPLYANDAPPVVGDSVASVLDAATDLVSGATHDPQPGRQWVHRVHGVEHGVGTLLDVYGTVLAARA